MSDYDDHLEQQLRTLDKDIEAARTRFEKSDVAGKVQALAQLVELRGRHDSLAARIAEAKKADTAAWSEVRTGFREEADALRDTLERWLTKVH